MSQLTSEGKVSAIKTHFEHHPEIQFDMSFVNNMEAKLENGQTLTPNMETALDNIIEKFKIE